MSILKQCLSSAITISKKDIIDDWSNWWKEIFEKLYSEKRRNSSKFLYESALIYAEKNKNSNLYNLLKNIEEWEHKFFTNKIISILWIKDSSKLLSTLNKVSESVNKIISQPNQEMLNTEIWNEILNLWNNNWILFQLFKEKHTEKKDWIRKNLLRAFQALPDEYKEIRDLFEWLFPWVEWNLIKFFIILARIFNVDSLNEKSFLAILFNNDDNKIKEFNDKYNKKNNYKVK